MIKVHSQPVIEPARQGGWRLTFWMGEAFDYTTPFRKLLNDMAEVLSRGNACSIQLPEYEEYEDFVEGTLRFGAAVLHIYYEHSLSFLCLSTDSYEILCDVAARLQSSVEVAQRQCGNSTSSRPN